MKCFVTILLYCTILLLACNDGAKVKYIQAPINPNGDSELALLMRAMFDDGMKIKQQIAAGKMPEINKSFEEIHSAKATEPEKAASEAYKLYGNAYLNSLKNLKESPKEDLEDMYEAMVNACMICHRAMCPGPMVRIEKMYLSK